MTKIYRRKRLDPVKTRETILASAFQLFAERGYDGTAVADIAAVAQVPKSLLQYHYGSKEELWKACLEQKAGPLIQALDRFLDGDEASCITDVINVRFHLLQENPQIARVLAWASMGTAPIPSFLEERQARLIALCGREPFAAEFPRFLLAIAAMDGWFLYRDLYRRVIGPIVYDAKFADQMLQLLSESAERPKANQGEKQ